MKKILLALILIGAAQMSYAQHAQDRSVRRQKITPEQRVEARADRLEKELLLTPDQKEAIIAIDKDIMEEVKNKKVENRAEVRGIRNRNEVAYKKVLTEEQYHKYEELKEERKEKRERRKK